MTTNRFLIMAAFAVVMGLAGYWLGRSHGLWLSDPEKYIVSDIFSLVVVPSAQGECNAAVGYEEKYVIGTFVVEPVRRLVCREYYFQERPDAKFSDAAVVLVRVDNGEYHWVLESQLVVPLRN